MTGGKLIAKGEELYDMIQTVFPGDVILEDRARVKISKKLKNSDIYPINVVVGRKVIKNGLWVVEYRIFRGIYISLISRLWTQFVKNRSVNS